MIVGTLSTEFRGSRQHLRGGQLAEIIATVLSEHGPDLLLCAGHSIATVEDLQRLLQDDRVRRYRGTIVLEVEKYNLEEDRPKQGQSNHCLFAIKNGKAKRLGRQLFATSGELAELDDQELSELGDALAVALRERQFSVDGHKCTVLCCGEINVIRGRNQPEFRWGEAEKAIADSDIVLNPTHDRMGNGGTLDKKRKLLSKTIDGRAQAYISSSNWNTKKEIGQRNSKKAISQKSDTKTLHTVYVNSRRRAQERVADPAGRYEYRWTDISL